MVEALIYKKIEMPEFDASFKEYQEKHGDFIGIFKGSVNSEGVNWCPDCVAAEGPIKEILFPLAASKKVPILEVHVGLRDAWKSPDHVLRKHPKVGLKCVPTLVYFTKLGILRKLEEEQICEKDLLSEFIE